MLQELPTAPRWPFGPVAEARRQVWLADALRDSGRSPEAELAYARAIELAPESHWGEEGRRGRARLPSAPPDAP